MLLESQGGIRLQTFGKIAIYTGILYLLVAREFIIGNCNAGLDTIYNKED